ncbi:tyrosine-type recombinase/integrase [Cloacibacterium normanense]|uniref:Phage integrase family protein n=2 Tax=Bacteria TaxID=2 RepID=A0A1E5UCS4_9FLAO|nr:tyrosine-type recombinase/integrase [Cloacibacterium normanense]AZI68526.1 integrase [Cloacibacterium normanense]OEL10716.1 phage integrase family protein [Cloacibacterium normanense]SDO63866.1 integrase/recombinase XerC [Cloacibacterium normanense]
MINKFLDYISVEKRYSQNTLVSYKKDLEDLLLFISETEGTEDLKKVDKKIIRNFIVSLSEKKIQKRSINRKLSSLRSFYLYLLKIGEIQVSPLETIPSLKFYAEKQIPISEEEMENLGEILESDSGNSLEKLIIETLYQTGMRKSELCNILLDQVDFSKSEISIKGKGNKQRVVPISENLLKQMREYIAIRKPNEDSGIYFFVRENGKKLSEKFVYSVVNRYLSLITLKKKKSPHILRHSFATHVLNNGAEISKVKKILGHSSLASTQVYTNGNIEQLKRVFNQAHPRAYKKED